MIAQIAVAAAVYAIDKPYSYRIPDNMTLVPGQRVRVPFGNGNRPSEGIVLAVENEHGEKLKPVQQPLEDEPLITPLQLRLAAFLRERCFCTFYEAARVMLPAGAWFRTQNTVGLTEDRSWETAVIRKAGARAVLERLDALGGYASEERLRGTVPDEETLHEALRYLAGKKWIVMQRQYRRRTVDKTEKIVSLTATPEATMDFAALRPRSARAQKSVLELLCGVGSAAVKDVCYYTGASVASIKTLERLGWVAFSERPMLRCSEIKPVQLTGPLVLNEQQQSCFEGLRAQLCADAPGAALLYGVTGSGKTSVYIKLIEQTLALGKSAVLLVPEIALTPQLLGLLAAYFGDLVAVLHSSLSAGERYDQWKRVREGAARVVVGTRSAVFAPCGALGLIILDEEQEHSYKSETRPRYSAREVALWRGRKENALVLMGSATPSVESMYHAQRGDYTLYTMRERYNGRPLPKVELVDMGQQLRDGNITSLSFPLRRALLRVKEENKQAILLLNRRGNSRALVCVDCGKAPECPRCSIRMTYHSANSRLMCHYCGYSEPAPERCPSCGGHLKTVGVGTQKVQQELRESFPDMSVRRMDADTVSALNTHEKILTAFEQGDDTILLGTQMVAKGLNLPRVTLVGVLDADLSLYTGGFRAGETTFDLITQVVGRAGRAEDEGTAIVQTLVPQHTVLNMAARQDYDAFYALELQLRRVQNAPPFGDYVLIVFQDLSESVLLNCSTRFRDSLLLYLRQPEYADENVRVMGPAPCPIPRINYHSRYQITLNCRLDKKLRQLLAHLLRQFGQDKANRRIVVYIDVNGFD